jgi:hypothetical protein
LNPNNELNFHEYDVLMARQEGVINLVGPWPDRILINRETKELTFVKVANKRHRFREGEKELLQTLEDAGFRVRVWVGGDAKKFFTVEDYISGGSMMSNMTLFTGQQVYNARSELHAINKNLAEFPNHPQRDQLIAKARYLNTRLAPLQQVEIVLDRLQAVTLDELEKTMNTPLPSPEEKLKRFMELGDAARKDLGLPTLEEEYGPPKKGDESGAQDKV